MTWREFRQKKNGKMHVWRIKQIGESYTTEHGQLNGAMQSFSDTPGDKGKVGTKAYVSAVDNSRFHVSREIRKKEESGYIEYLNGELVKQQVTNISFDDFLPKSFCSYKPQTDIDPKTLEKLHQAKKIKFTRKYDGQCHLAVYHSWGWEIYTRRMDLTSERFPEHLATLETLGFEPGTILVGEMVVSKQDGRDDFKAISRICRSDPLEARKLITTKEVTEPTYIIFDILFHNGKDLKSESYATRSKLWNHIQSPFIRAVDYFNLTPSNWESYAKEHGWEGFVAVDTSAIPGDKFYSYDGDAKRPKGTHKLKPVHTEDCVVYAAVKGNGKRQDGVGAVFIKQLHPESKEYFPAGKVGSGFTEEDLFQMEEVCHKNGISIFEKDKEVETVDLKLNQGVVVEIQYSERQSGTNKFRFPVFTRIRTDKSVKECFAQRLAPEEE